jgi:hypothetical protein
MGRGDTEQVAEGIQFFKDTLSLQDLVLFPNSSGDTYEKTDEQMTLPAEEVLPPSATCSPRLRRTPQAPAPLAALPRPARPRRRGRAGALARRGEAARRLIGPIGCRRSSLGTAGHRQDDLVAPVDRRRDDERSCRCPQ